MHLLEDEPEKEGRWKRLGTGALIAMMIAGGLVYGANRFEPTRKLIQQVVQLTVAPEPPKKQDLPPPRTVPPPPPPKRAPPKQAKKAVVAPDKPPPPQNQAPAEETIGLDAESFGEGTGGPAFQVGNSQMGTPGTVAKPPPKPLPPTPRVAPQIVPFRSLTAEKPPYSRRARELGIQGLVIVELEVDEQGQVRRARLRKGLEESLDKAILEFAKSTRFRPAMLEGRPIAHTQLVRYRFALEN